MPYPGLAAALARDTAERAALRLKEALWAGATYRLTLAGPLPDRLVVTPDALVTATLEGAQDILRGRFSLPSGVIDGRGPSPFDLKAEDAARAELHGFQWLAHLEKAGGGTAQNVARALVEDWLDRFERYEAFAWRPDILGARCVAWAAHFRFLAGDGALLFRSRLMRALAEQTRHLSRALSALPHGPDRLCAAAALVTLRAAMPEGEKRHTAAIEALRLAADAALLGDGGIATRSPRDQALALAAITRAARALADTRQPQPPFLGAALLNMRACLNLMRHGDGGLAGFNGADEADARLLDELIGEEATEAHPAIAPHWRYARMTGGALRVIADLGGPPPDGFATAAHAAPLAFEMSQGGTRLIVNGGVARARGAQWVDAARRTAAHATLQLGGEDAGAILNGGMAGRLGPRLYGGTAKGDLHAAEGGQWAEGSHDLYRAAFGVTHRRRLFLDEAGEDLRGEDHLSRAGRGGGHRVAIRFPLHPDCRATLAQGGDSVLIAPATGPAWRLRAGLTGAGDSLSLEPAVYMGGPSVRQTEAIVIAAAPGPAEWTMRWAFKREPGPKRTTRRLA